jgi:hypothetical protein
MNSKQNLSNWLVGHYIPLFLLLLISFLITTMLNTYMFKTSALEIDTFE